MNADELYDLVQKGTLIGLKTGLSVSRTGCATLSRRLMNGVEYVNETHD